MLGIWKNVEELEECLTLQELELIVKSAHQRERRRNKFMAALKGIDLDDDAGETADERFKRIQRRAESKLQGKSEEELELAELGLDIIVEE